MSWYWITVYKPLYLWSLFSLLNTCSASEHGLLSLPCCLGGLGIVIADSRLNMMPLLRSLILLKIWLYKCYSPMQLPDVSSIKTEYIWLTKNKLITAEWLSKVWYDVAIKTPLKHEQFLQLQICRMRLALIATHARGFGVISGCVFDVRMFHLHECI